MALTFRSPIEEALTSFSSTEQSLVSSTAVGHYRDQEQENFHLFNLALNAHAKMRLIQAGIYLSPHSGMPHSHPCCKTLENFFLYKVLPTYIDNSYYMVGIKEAKINFLKTRNPDLGMIECINRFVTSNDRMRYPNTLVNVQSQRIPQEFAAYLERSETLKNLLPRCITQKARKLFLHDELHYWSTKDLCAFLSAVKPEVILGTIVFPTEIFAGCRESLNPWCYSFQVVGRKLHFFPDGNMAEGYEQPLSGGFLLQTSKIVLPCGETYCIDLLCSKFAHHLVSITRGEAVVRKERFFGDYEATTCKGLMNLSNGVAPCIRMPYDVLSRIYRYLRTLLKPDKESAMAKLSQIVPEPSAYQIKFVQEFANLVIGSKNVNNILSHSFKNSLMCFAQNVLPVMLVTRIKAMRELSLDEFVQQMSPFSYRMILREIDHRYEFTGTFNDEWFMTQDQPFDAETYDNKFMTGVPSWEGMKFCDSAYFMESYCVELEVSTAGLGRVLGQYMVLSRKHPKQRRPTVEDTMQYLAAICKKHEILNLWQMKADTSVVCKIAVKYVNARQAGKYGAMHFMSGAFYWFLNQRRSYRKFLQGNEHNMRPNIEVVKIFDKVLKQLCSVLRSPSCEEPTSGQEEGVNACVLAPGRVMLNHTDLGLWVHEDTIVKHKDSCNLLATYKIMHRQVLSETEQEWPGLLMEANGVSAEWDLILTGLGIYARTASSILLEELSFETVCLFEGEQRRNYKHAQEPCAHGHPWSGFSISKADGSRFLQALKLMAEYLQTGRGHFLLACILVKQGDKGQTDAPEEAQEEKVPPTGEETSHGRSQKPEEGKSTPVSYELMGVQVCVQSLRNLKDVQVRGVAADGDCFYSAIGVQIGLNGKTVRTQVGKKMQDEGHTALSQRVLDGEYAQTEEIAYTSRLCKLEVHIYNYNTHELHQFVPEEPAVGKVLLKLCNEHFEIIEQVADCLPRALAEAIGRREYEVMLALSKMELGEDAYLSILKDGIETGSLLAIFTKFGIAASIYLDDQFVVLNPSGTIKATFLLKEGHITYVRPEKSHLIHGEFGRYQNIESLGVDARARCILLNQGSTLNFNAVRKYAEVLRDSLLMGTTGIMCSELYNNSAPISLKYNEEKMMRRIHCIFGVYGAGKSTLYKKFFSASYGKQVFFVSPRRAIAEEIEAEITPPEEKQQPKNKRAKSANWHVQTFEIFLKQLSKISTSATVLLDEIQLYPNGYLDCLAYNLDKQVLIVAAGDFAQANYDNPKDRSLLAQIPDNMNRLLDGSKYNYYVQSARFLRADFIGRLPCNMGKASEEGEAVSLHDGLEDEITAQSHELILVSSFAEKNAIRPFFPPGCNIKTFGESTGLTVDKVVIIVTEESKKTCENRWITALSRARRHVSLVSMLDCSSFAMRSFFENRALGKFINRTATLKDLMDILPGEPILVPQLLGHVGKAQGEVEEKLQGDPWLKCAMYLGQVEDLAEELELVENLQEERMQTHLPHSTKEQCRVVWHERFKPSEAREKRMGPLTSQQFTDKYRNDKFRKLTNAAERFEAIYPRHRAGDTVTFVMAVRKRLRFSNARQEMGKFHNARHYGRTLLDIFLKYVPLKKGHNENFMAASLREFEAKKVSKSAAIIQNHAGRSCRDWLIDVGLVFMKSQLCTKYEKRFTDAKAAQSIVCFQHSVLCRFAPYMRYIEKKVNEVLRPNFYIHSGKNLNVLNEWVKKGDFTSVCTESDYEAFDASQDEWIMAFEVALMEYLGLPKDLVSDYIYIKTHLGSKLGQFAIMRFSGEACTFLFNTLANMLFTFLRYDVKGNEHICFAGDDMCANRRLRQSEEHLDLLKKFKLKAKVQYTRFPTFCGWRLCEEGIFKKPQLIYERLCIAKETDNLQNCIDNYAIEVSYAYKLGERLHKYSDDEEMNNHYNCVRVIIKNKHLLKSDVYKEFEGRV
ncbi:RNA-dependent RNA polymerase [Clivia carlavirus A]|uniref:RNA-dependent RNA polymerase n=1 Tax=Clivia carlavirus A TaxID=2838077 RepID=A0A8E7NDU9_9VIRU|nr:RNA-dependent RNA polymerase [Clivia carlavirus A]QVY19178.1 RNA-dependent RNA polymerase [Clivia carlavirus A]